MRYLYWETPNIERLLLKRQEEEAGMAGITTSANVGSYPVPLGPVLRRQTAQPVFHRKQRKRR